MDLSYPSPRTLDAPAAWADAERAGCTPGARADTESAAAAPGTRGATGFEPRQTLPILWHLSFPVLVVDAFRRLLYSNLAAQALLDAGQVFMLRETRLECVRAGDRTRLDRALQACFGVRTADAEGVRRGRGGGESSFCLAPYGPHPGLTVSVARLDASEGDGAVSVSPTATLILNRPASLGPAHKSVLRDLFELTDSEAAVAEGLWEGLTIPEIAHARMTSTTTVRTQIRSIFAKTLVSRQQDLIRLFASLPQLAIGGEAGRPR
ncbi:MAG: hypothetical protein KAY46_09120 [Burkholderiaceae bacterium]|nr:hypothetical protein [Burkholderiaceae bacterium]